MSTTMDKPKRKKIAKDPGDRMNDKPPGMPLAVWMSQQSPKSLSGERLRVHPKQLVPHPDNEKPSEEAIAAMAESLATEGQLEAVLVRLLSEADEIRNFSTYQIISGETRTRGAVRLGWDSIEIEVEPMDDARALRILAVANAARKDKSPIAKARLIVRLCDPLEKGGSGLTREAAAKIFDLQSGGGASNLVRLLELPQVWQDRVASGELAQSYARELLALSPLGVESAAWDDLEKEWPPKGNGSWEAFSTRDSLSEFVDGCLYEHSRPIEKGVAHSFEVEPRLCQSHPIRFKLTPAIEEELRIVDVRVSDGGTSRRATNVKLYDSLQLPAIKVWNAKKNKGKATDDESDEPDARLTPKQQAAADAAKKEKAKEVLAKRIERWRAAWLRELVAEEVSRGVHAALAGRICLWLQVQARNVNYREWGLMQIEESLATIWGRQEAWIGVLLGNNATIEAEIVAHWLRTPGKDGYPHPFPDENVEDLIELLKIDLAGRWDLLQQGMAARYQKFFELHNSDQLDALGQELQVGTTGASKKSGKVAAFLAAPKTLKLPNALKSVRGKRGA